MEEEIITVIDHKTKKTVAKLIKEPRELKEEVLAKLKTIGFEVINDSWPVVVVALRRDSSAQ